MQFRSRSEHGAVYNRRDNNRNNNRDNNGECHNDRRDNNRDNNGECHNDRRDNWRDLFCEGPDTIMSPREQRQWGPLLRERNRSEPLGN